MPTLLPDMHFSHRNRLMMSRKYVSESRKM